MICKQCKKEFTQSHGHQKYCSKECWREEYNSVRNKEHKKNYNKEYRLKNKESIKERTTKYRKLNLEKHRAIAKKTLKKITYKKTTWWLIGHSLPYWKHKLSQKKYKNITPEYMEDLTIKQGGCCYYTGIPLRPFKEREKKQYFSKELQRISIDKLDPEKGYVKGNVVLASMFINKMKGKCTLSQFKTLILMISKRLNFNEKNHTPDKDLTRIISKINKDYMKKAFKDVKKTKKLYAKNLVKLVKRFPGKLVIEKGKLVRTN